MNIKLQPFYGAILLAVSITALVTGLPVMAGPEPGLTGTPESDATLPGIHTSKSATKNNEDSKIIDPIWWKNVQRNLAKYEYYPSESGKGLQAPNRAHNLRTYFDSTGIRLQDRTAVGSPELAGLSLVGIGRGDVLAPVEAGTVTHAGARVEIQRSGVIEWYENSPRGLEQGFTLAAPMEGEGPVVLELAVEHAKASLRGQSIELATDAGRRLNYGNLIARDANGLILASRLEVPSPQRMQLIVEDAGAAYPVVIDPLITGTADAILESNQPDIGGFDAAAFGGTVAIAGDVNGDGFDDVIVGARGWDLDNGLFDEGAAFVFLGSATGIVGSDPATAHAAILGDQAAAEFGTSVAGAGDVNSDGFDDIIVGAPHYEGTFRGDFTLSVKGAAFVFYGGPSGITATSPAMADARIDANQGDALLGFSVAGAGDVNGDGFDDIIVGVPRQGSPTFPPNIPPNQGQGFGGAAVVFHGSAAGITASGFDDADATLLPYPAGFPVSSQQFMGSGVSGAGDVNGDGFDDVLVFIDGAALFLGSATGIVGTDPTTAHAHIAGPGVIVSGAGDVNGDGFDDIILGAPGFPDLGNPPGASFERSGTFGVFLGSSVGIIASDFLQAQTLVQGVHASRVAAAGDIDNDGFDDVLVGALGFVGGLNSEGAAYVYRGGPSGIVASSELDAYVRIESNQSEAVRRLNRNDLGVGGAGDVNGDGFADVIVGFGYYDVDQLDEGAAFVYHGGPAPINPNQPPVSIPGPNQVFVDFDNMGRATITVDGSSSFDPGGSITNYAWLEGETLLGTSSVLTTSLLASGDHRLVLNVTDDGGLTRGAGVTVRVEPVETVQLFFDDFTIGFGSWVTGGDVTLSSVDTFPDPPQVRIGASGSFLSRTIVMPVDSTGMTVSFWGKASQFSAADELLVKVSVDGGPFTTIHTITSAESDDAYVFYGGTAIPLGLSWFPTTASNIVLEFESNMTTGLFFVDLVKVKALLAPPGSQLPLAGESPIANAGADTTVDDNDSDGFEFVFLDGTLSADPDGSIATYEWFEVTSGGTSLLGTGATLGAWFERRVVPGVLGPEISGSHTVQLIVTDNVGHTASDTVVVTVNGALTVNQPPVANAGLDLTVTDLNGDTLEFVHFDGRGSTDPDGSIVSYNWTENGNPLNNAVTFTITMPIGVHTVQLEVTDNQGATSTDIVVITVIANTPAPPIDSFSATPTSITLGESSILSWTTTGAESVVINAGPDLPLDGSISVIPTTTTLYILTAIGPGIASSANVTVTVNPAPPSDNTPPSTSITSPAGGATVNGTITISATASDNVGVTQVQFFVDGVLLSTDTTAPYSASWDTNTADDGSHALSAKALDAAGNEGTSPTVNVTVDNGAPPQDTTPPTVGITSPAEGATVAGTATISASAADNVGVTAVEFYVDTQLFSTDTTAPYSASWDTNIVPDRSHALSAKALDAAGNEGTSPTVNVTVQNTSSSSTTTTTFSDRLDGGATNTHSLTIDVPGPVDANLTWDDNRADPYLTVFDPNTSVVASQGGTQPIQVSFTGTVTGVYVFQIQNQDNKRKADYVLQITHPVGSPAPPDTVGPTVIVTNPAPGSTIGGTVTIAASAFDNDAVTEVQFFVDGVLLNTDISLPYLASWDTTTEVNGPSTITAQATDPSGNVGMSASVNVTVDNGAPPPDTTPPTASVSGPADGTTVRGSITISATASDDVGVTQVQFLVDGVLLSTDTTAPYGASWNTTSAADGAHSLTAEGSDAAGNTGTSVTVDVTVDNTGPTVNVTSPAGGATVSATLTIIANASDPSGVTQVQFFVDGALLSTDTTAPYSASWDTTAAAAGAHSLTAEATDSVGNVGLSGSVNVTVDNADVTPPTAGITSPSGGATVSSTITISATASDNVGVTQVQFFADGVLLSTDTTAPYSASWDTITTAAGAHSLTVQVSDAAGNTGTSVTVNVTVDNSAPPAPELNFSASGVPASIDRGDEFTTTATVTNTGGATATGLPVTVTWSPGQILRLENPRNPTQSVGSVAPGSSSSVSWLIRGDKEGSGTITFTLEDSGGSTVDVVTQSITVIK